MYNDSSIDSVAHMDQKHPRDVIESNPFGNLPIIHFSPRQLVEIPCPPSEQKENIKPSHNVTLKGTYVMSQAHCTQKLEPEICDHRELPLKLVKEVTQ